MVLTKYKLPNDNVLIWLGRGGIWGKSEGVDNVLVLAGGDVLFLQTSKILELRREEVREDIKNLSYEELAKKYELPGNGDLWKELKEGLETRKYPPFVEKTENRISDFKGMISSYIWNISQLKDPREKIRHLEEIIDDCRSHISKAKAELIK